MTRRLLLVFLALALAAVVLLLPFRDPLQSIDPVALRLLPPGTRVPAFLDTTGKPIPIAGFDSAQPSRPLFDWRQDVTTVTYRHGHREKTIPIEQLKRDPEGKPLIQWMTFPAGTDTFGRDLWARLLQGAWVSLGVGLGGVAGAGLLGCLAGLAAALGARWLDHALGRLGDALLAIPRILLVMAMAALFRPSGPGLALLLACTGWPGIARLVRSDTRALAASDLAASARATGASPWRLALRHFFPFAASTVLVAAGLRVGPYVLLEASLSFLGFGIPPPYPSWGNILAEGREVLFEAWWITAIPGALLAGTVLAVNAGADRLRRALERTGPERWSHGVGRIH